MDYIYLGNSGLRVPKYILGTIPISGTNGFEAAGNVKEEEARRIAHVLTDVGLLYADHVTSPQLSARRARVVVIACDLAGPPAAADAVGADQAEALAVEGEERAGDRQQNREAVNQDSPQGAHSGQPRKTPPGEEDPLTRLSERAMVAGRAGLCGPATGERYVRERRRRGKSRAGGGGRRVWGACENLERLRTRGARRPLSAGSGPGRPSRDARSGPRQS